MCGIVGIFEKNTVFDHTQRLSIVQRMLSAISHRGFPSLNKIYSAESFSIGCVRLPIVDEINGVQPMFSESGRIVLVLNGEIYNYETLKFEYLVGKKFKTESDSEVLANLLETYDIETTLSLLEGMFAFIAMDLFSERYYFARDQIGIKPLYISYGKQVVFVASEIKSFDKHLDTISELLPQHYYDSKSGIKKWDKVVSEKTNNLRHAIAESVKEQVNTTLPIAVFLSGGIDSSIICYESNQYHPNVTAFTIGKKDSNDMINATKLCEEFDFNFEPIFINEEEVLNYIEDTIFSIESFEPNHIRAGTLSYLLSKHVSSKGYIIALCGEGADELFAGYPEFVELLRQTNNDYAKLNSLVSTFVNELNLTQLRRIDRTGMSFGLEVRPPFLSSKIISYSKALLPQEKLPIKNGSYITKFPLREAYKDVLPKYIVNRVKSVFSEGAGFDSNGYKGPFWEFTKNKISESEIRKIQGEYPEYSLKTHEEVYYFKIYKKYFNLKQIMPNRPSMSAL